MEANEADRSAVRDAGAASAVPKSGLGNALPTAEPSFEDLEEAGERFSIGSLIGEGGMGTVHLALDTHVRGAPKRVAIKRMRAQARKDPRNVELFFREARLASRLRHPNVVHALAFGKLAGEPYLAMEYVEGRTLDEILEAARASGTTLSPTLATYIMAELCEGLYAVHSLQDDDGKPLHVVHRDVTPHNVIVSKKGDVRLLDFGIAKANEEGSKLTRTGEVRGKMAYMSPEQALGDPVKAESDLFAVGALLYECLVGTRMWGDGTELEVMRKLALETPPDLPEFMEAKLRALFKRLVSKKPSERPASAKDVAVTLHALTQDGAREELERLYASIEKHFAPVKSATSTAPKAVALPVAPSKTRRPVFGVVFALFVALGGFAVYRARTHDPVSSPVPSAGAPSAPPRTSAPNPIPFPSAASTETLPPSPSPAPDVRSAKPVLATSTVSPVRSSAAPTARATVPAAAPSAPPSPTAPNVDPHPF